MKLADDTLLRGQYAVAFFSGLYISLITFKQHDNGTFKIMVS